MSSFKDIGQLIQVPINQLTLVDRKDIPPFIIASLSEKLLSPNTRNWIPVIVQEIVPRQYSVIANQHIFAAMEAAGQEKIWVAVIPEDDESTEQVKFLTRQKTATINLCTADYDMIYAALSYLRDQATNKLSKLDINLATQRIFNAPGRFAWSSLQPLTKLKCGISKQKLNMFAGVFNVQPEPIEIKPVVLNVATYDELLGALQTAAVLPDTKLANVNLELLVQSIVESVERQYWYDLKPLTKLKHKLTPAKLKGLDQLLHLEPTPPPNPNNIRYLLEKMSVSALKKDAKSRGIVVPTSAKKADIVKLLL